MRRDDPTPRTCRPIDAAAQNHLGSLIWLTSLFFMWGLITSLNDILIPHLKAAFTLSYVQAMLIQFCFFGAYFVMSLPSGWLVERIGYKRGIIVGLLDRGRRLRAVLSGRGRGVVPVVPRRAVRARVRHHAAAGRGQSVRGDLGPAAHARRAG